MQYEKNKNFSLISDTIPIKSLHEVIKVLHLIIAPRTKECGCYDAWKFFARHCANGRSQNQFINVDRSYTPVEHSRSLRINIAFRAMNRLTARILDVSNEFHNRSFPIHERVYVSPPPYYIDWFEISYPNFPLNWYEGLFFLQRMNGIWGTKPYVQKLNRLLNSVVTIIKYNKSIIDYVIYIKVFSDGTVSYLTIFTVDVLNTSNNEI